MHFCIFSACIPAFLLFNKSGRNRSDFCGDPDITLTVIDIAVNFLIVLFILGMDFVKILSIVTLNLQIFPRNPVHSPCLKIYGAFDNRCNAAISRYEQSFAMLRNCKSP